MKEPSNVRRDVVEGIDYLFQEMKNPSLRAIECAEAVRHIEESLGYYKRHHLREDKKIHFQIFLDVEEREAKDFNVPVYFIPKILSVAKDAERLR